MQFNSVKVIDDLKSALNRDISLQRFSFYPLFKELWYNFFNLCANNTTVWTFGDVKEEDQLFTYPVDFPSGEFIFHFSISYLRLMLQKTPKFFPMIEFNYKNNNLYHNEKVCNFTLEDVDNKTYSDLKQAFVIPMGMDDFPFVVIDGNHRISQQIKNGKTEISALYFDFNFAKLALITPIDLCVYSFLEDISKLKYNLNKGVNHQMIFDNLSISHKNNLYNINLLLKNRDINK